VVVNNGRIVTSGSISELRNSGTLASILDENDDQSEFENSVELAAENAVKVSNNSEQSSTPGHNADSSTEDDSQPIKKVSKPKVLVEEEERQTGMVKFKIYKSYFRANGNILYWLFFIGVFIATRVMQIMENWWLQVWSNAKNETTPSLFNFVRQDNLVMIDGIFDDIYKSHSIDYYLNIYVLITLLSIVIGFLRFVWLYYGSLKASEKLYRKLLHQ
ncbi:12908_t:CDS:2, partial [Racocetra persica]